MATPKRKKKAKPKAKKKSKSGKKSTGITRKKIKYDPKFVRTRENNLEFTHVGKAVKLIRLAFRELSKFLSDSTSPARLSKVCMDVLKGDQINGRGERTVGCGELDRLRYFNFNNTYSFFSTVFTRNIYAFDRNTGVVTISIPAFRPTVSVEWPLEITHFTISAIGIAIDFDTDRYEFAMTSLEEIRFTDDLLPAQDILLQLPANDPRPVLLIMSIRYFEKADGRYYIRKDENINATTIVEVFKPVNSTPGIH